MTPNQPPQPRCNCQCVCNPNRDPDKPYSRSCKHCGVGGANQVQATGSQAEMVEKLKDFGGRVDRSMRLFSSKQMWKEIAQSYRQMHADIVRAKNDLRLARIRLEILTGRMRGCHEETGKHELLDEADMFCEEAKEAESNLSHYSRP